MPMHYVSVIVFGMNVSEFHTIELSCYKMLCSYKDIKEVYKLEKNTKFDS
jgi:hypothetical protein